MAEASKGVSATPPSEENFPGDSGVWFFIIADMCMFALFFILFMSGQASDPETYRQSRAELNPAIGLINTLILISSGWWLARAVEAGRAGNWLVARNRVGIGLVVGLGFAITKIYEYTDKISSGITLQTNEFFAYYFAFTGIHFLHFIVGVGVLVVTMLRLSRSSDEDKGVWLESAAAYWHMVDLLWIILFPMLYLSGGAV